MRIVSIDGSTKSTGISLFVDGEYVSSTLLSFEKYNMEMRFHIMGKSILTELDKMNPDKIYMEEAAVLRNAQTQRFLVRLQGIVYAWTIRHDVPCEFVRPSAWRSKVGIKTGRRKRIELKEDAINMVKDQFGVTCNDDVAESILIGYAYLNNNAANTANNEGE